MAALSRLEDEHKTMAVLVANPIFILGTPDFLPGGTFDFEIFKEDADGLTRLVGKAEYYVINSENAFFGRLKSLVPTTSSHPGLARLPEKPVLRATMEVFPNVPPISQ